MIFSLIIERINFIIWDCFLIYFLIFAGLYFGIKTRFFQFRCFKDMVRLIKQGLDKKIPKKSGISSLQALTVSIASRVGTGNLAGVAFAISVGGPGAIFWMWIFVLLIGTANSFVESTLSQLYKKEAISQTQGISYFYGGTSYYIEKGLNQKNLGIIFAILVMIFAFVLNMVQSHTIGQALTHLASPNLKNITLKATSIILPLLAMWPLFGGTLRIAKISEWVIPIMAISYILVTLIVSIINIRLIPQLFTSIIREAFNLKTSIPGGLLGGVIICGMRRSVFSSEAGSGTAPYASACAEVDHPVEQSILQILSIFIDTLVICSATAFLILLANVNNTALQGIEIAQAAMKVHFGQFGPIFLAIALFIFGYTSIIGNYFYGENSLHFLKSNRFVLLLFRCSMMAFICIGTLMNFHRIWAFADIILGLLTVTNLTVILLLGKTVFNTLKDYERKVKTKLPLSFKTSDIGMEKKLDVWN